MMYYLAHLILDLSILEDRQMMCFMVRRLSSLQISVSSTLNPGAGGEVASTCFEAGAGLLNLARQDPGFESIGR